MRVCNVPGCPELIDGTGRCLTHRREQETRRGTMEQRGYGRRHKALRKRWAREHAKGLAECWRCGRRISPLEPFDLGHCDDDRDVWHGAECVPCNRATATHGGCPHPSHQARGGGGGASPPSSPNPPRLARALEGAPGSKVFARPLGHPPPTPAAPKWTGVAAPDACVAVSRFFCHQALAINSDGRHSPFVVQGALTAHQSVSLLKKGWSA